MGLTNQTPEDQVQKIFDEIAGNYDRMNDLISLQSHKRWRNQMVDMMALRQGDHVLDLCCGTADLTIATAGKVGSTGHVVGLDFSKEMVKSGQKKVEQAGLEEQIEFQIGDAMNLPFESNSFDAVTVGFGLRNVPDAAAVLREMRRVVKPGGTVACLETSQPQNPVIKFFWKQYFKLVPVMGQVVSHHFKQYSYLEQTAGQFVSAPKLKQMFETAGLRKVKVKTLMFGAAAIHIGKK